MFKKIRTKLGALLHGKNTRGKNDLPYISYSIIKNINRPVPQAEIQDGDFYCVVTQSERRWVMFRCPCGCNEIITLSLQKVHYPNWQLRERHERRPTLYPSVWRDVGCYSHFWIEDGRVFWCKNTGVHPDDAREY